MTWGCKVMGITSKGELGQARMANATISVTEWKRMHRKYIEKINNFVHIR
jgi:hypothetical protein